MSWYGTKKASKLQTMDKSKILVFDTETTGLNPQFDEILQITILDGTGCTLFGSYIKPKSRKSWSKAEAINCISPAMVKNAPHFSEVRKEIQNLFDNAKLVVGFNVEFDIRFVESAGIVVTGKTFDVMDEAAKYMAAMDGRHVATNPSLEKCAHFFKVGFSPHNSCEDARATFECFDRMITDPHFLKLAASSDQNQEEDYTKHKTPRYVLRFNPKKRGLIKWGVLFFLIGYIGFYILSGIHINGFEIYIQELSANFATFPNSSLYLLTLLLIGAGTVLTLLGIIKLLFKIIRSILRFPQWIISMIKKLFSSI